MVQIYVLMGMMPMSNDRKGPDPLTLKVCSKATIRVLARECPQFKDELLLEEGSVFWLGSVGADEHDATVAFLEEAKRGDVVSMSRHASFAVDLIYGVLSLRKPSYGGYRLLVLRMSEDPWCQQQCLYTRVVEDIRVAGGVEEVRVDVPPYRFGLLGMLRTLFKRQ